MTLKITIIGLGQIGGSLGLALSQNKDRYILTGYDQSRDVTRTAEKKGVVGKIAKNAEAASREADMIFLALPVNEIRETLKSIAKSLKAGAIVLETAPVKTGVAEWVKEYLPAGCLYIGLTPALNPDVLEEITTGIEAARPDLFQGGRVGITILDNVDEASVELAASLITRLGAKPYFTEFAEVDGVMAFAHLLPGLASAAMTEAITSQAGWADIRKMAGVPFVASMRPLDLFEASELTEAVWQNRSNSVRVLDEFISVLNSLREEIQSGEMKDLKTRLNRAWEARLGWRKVRAGGDWQPGEMGQQDIPDFGDFVTRQIGLGKILENRDKKRERDDKLPR
jgi:prephenate dehydrogenase